MADFDARIELRYFTDSWGPFNIDVAGGIPEGQTIAYVTIKAYAGRVKPSSDLSEMADISAQIIEQSPSDTVISGTQIYWKMQYPADESLKGQKITLIFEVTLSSGGKYPFYLYYAKIA